LKCSFQPSGSRTAPMPQRWDGTTLRNSFIAAARCRRGTSRSKCSHMRVWSRALMLDLPQAHWGVKRVMRARRATCSSPALPTTSLTRWAASLSEYSIIGSRRPWSALPSARVRTSARFR